VERLARAPVSATNGHLIAPDDFHLGSLRGEAPRWLACEHAGEARGAGGRPWLADGVVITSRLGSPETTALVEPRAFTTGLMHAAQAHGAVLRLRSSTCCAARAEQRAA
jgi:hypothetical protein